MFAILFNSYNCVFVPFTNSFFNGLPNGLLETNEELITVKSLSKIEKRSVLQKEIIKSISDSPLTENQKNFVNDNINLITDQLIEKSNKVLDDIISKKVDKELKNNEILGEMWL